MANPIRRMRTISILSWLVSAIIAISFASAAIFNQNFAGGRALPISMLSLILFMIINVITRHLEIQSEFDAIKTLLEHRAGCNRMGDALNIAEEAMILARRATAVKNVFAPFGLSDDVNFTLYCEEVNLEKRLQLVNAAVSKKGTWTEICSQEGLMHRNFALQNVAMELKDGEDRYEALCLRESYPIINFTIFEYPDHEKEVWFGWGLHPEQMLAPVYSCKIPEVVEMFERYWETLRKDAISIRSRSEVFNREVIAGAWMSAAYGSTGDLQDITGIYIDFEPINEHGRDRRFISITGAMLTADGRDDGRFAFNDYRLKPVELSSD